MRMENVIQTFVNEEFGAVRTLMKDGQPWFVANDVANALGYSKPRNAVATHVDEDDALKQGV
ncbi:MAG: toxin Bro, partial [Oscillospiraceae bacterium]|nr:toxin Bro [Oscillospiraceae bacterium]